MKSTRLHFIYCFSLLGILLALTTTSLWGQELADTRWRVLNADNDLIGYFDFGSDDTLTFSFDNVSFSNLATYAEDGNNLTVFDFSGGPCGSAPPPGNYTFQIANNLLQFTLIDDPCTSRALTFVNSTWIGVNIAGPGFGAAINLSNLSPADGIIINGINEVDLAGTSVSRIGDFNDDGIDDVLIGASGADINGTLAVGSSYVVFGSVSPDAIVDLSTIDGINGIVFNGEAEFDAAGGSVNTAGDVNGDGIVDIIIGATGADPGGNNIAGKSYVVFGTSNLPASLDLSTLDGNNGFALNGIDDGDNSGVSVNTAGDLNGDGFDDLIIGANSADPGGTFIAGESYVVFGAMSFPASLNLETLNGTNGFIINGINAEDRSGRSVSTAGDVNDDGMDDLIIGATGAAPNGVINAGACYVVFGSNTFPASLNLSNLDGSNGITINGFDEGGSAGFSVADAGDVNADGIDDLIIGAPGASPGGVTAAGSSYVVFGSSTLPTTLDLSTLNGTTGFALTGINPNDLSGASVSSAGDVNGDGSTDLIIGADAADPNGDNQAGQAYVVYGSTNFPASLALSTLDGTNGFIVNGPGPNAFLGRSVDAAGDVNADGMDDLILGASGAAVDGNLLTGQSFILFGKSSVTSIETVLLTASINLFPNPTDSRVIIELATDSPIQDAEIRCYDLQGRLMSIPAQELGDQRFEVDLSTLPPGQYYLQVVSDRQSATAKVVRLP
ncbi:MAG: T9SS type A sorting domain-containing protein [Bacteroidota bacterium]